MPRTLAGEEGHVQVQELLRKHPETIQLVKALREKRIRDASTLLEQEKINVNHYEPDGTTLLHLVLATQDLKLLATMLENPNLAIDATDSSGRTALAIALATGNFEATYALLQSNARLDAVDTAIVTAILRHAASTNDTEMVAALLKHGVRPAATNEKGETALHFAAANGHTAIVQTLLENDKSLLGRCDQKDVAVKGHSCINATNQAGESPLFVATANGHIDVVKALVQAKAKTHHLSNDGSTLLHAAAIGGNPRVLEYILPLCCDLEACDEMKRTPLYVAAEKGHTSAVNTLFDSGASVFAIKKGDKTTVFMVASNHGPVVKALLKKLLPMPTTSGMSYKALTLHRANLVAAKAHLALRNTKLQTAVDVASGAVRDQLLAANTFVEAELHRLEQATQREEAALAAAITARDWTTTLALLGEGVSAMASQDQEALVAAVTDTGNRELLRALLSMAVDANQLESVLQQALAGAVANNKVLLVMDVLHTFANTVHVTTTSGPSPLHIAANTGSVVLLSMLLACPTLNIDAVNEEGYTALALAVQTNQVDAALVLRSVGANVSILLPVF
ncbi:hypothetical protein SDRG_15502 [Saprolegnia diclina VS20]|uniref:Uncharacterized protein n=1 Tax=Saprolegnia diclina (strain VS20) TaxID=1156394 RepID=T0PMM1_SAPDV|nr:hypothetical protein SDRG_15502 [Saprolegnia diclina VS20]EQC26664.1 hypothetical protein SDRG_15502 [Saprolegnia diclina VS20]|eukprot:XP_008619899.1 hypothetical protein SDRG_15502 [Saprolegnia diclina VS20]